MRYWAPLALAAAARSRISFRSIPFLLILTATISLPVRAQLVSGRLTTSLYTWEKFDTVGSSETFARGFESILLDASQDKFSLHTNVQFAATLKKTLDETPDYRVFTLYGRVQDIANTLDLWFGRLPYYAGAGVGTLDGAMGSARFASNTIRLTMYGGGRVPGNLEFDGGGPLKTNFSVGAQVISTSFRDTHIGLSYVSRKHDRAAYWTTRPDSLYNPVTVYIETEPLEEEIASADVEYGWRQTHLRRRILMSIAKNTVVLGWCSSLSDRCAYGGASYIHHYPTHRFNSFFQF
jgi:hypothetical protein